MLGSCTVNIFIMEEFSLHLELTMWNKRQKLRTNSRKKKSVKWKTSLRFSGFKKKNTLILLLSELEEVWKVKKQLPREFPWRWHRVCVSHCGATLSFLLNCYEVAIIWARGWPKGRFVGARTESRGEGVGFAITCGTQTTLTHLLLLLSNLAGNVALRLHHLLLDL